METIIAMYASELADLNGSLYILVGLFVAMLAIVKLEFSKG